MTYKIDWQNLFKLEDFGYVDGNHEYDEIHCQKAVDVANRKIREIIEEAPTVYGEPAHSSPGRNCWTLEKASSDTHKAKLIEIEEIK